MAISPSSLLRALDSYKYRPTAEIGCGSFGRVFAAFSSPRRRDVAVKVVPLGYAVKPPRSPPTQLISVCTIENEIVRMQNLRHANLIHFFDRFLACGQVCVVMELAHLGNLKTLAVTYRTLRLTQIPGVFRQIVAAVHFLHSRDIQHGALHCENVLFQENLRVKLTDFGLPRTRLNAKQSGLGAALPSGEPPETRLGKDYDLVKADMWGLGRLLYAAVQGRLLLDSGAIRRDSLWRDDPHPQHQSSADHQVVASARDLTFGLLEHEPARRLSLEKVQHHKLLEESENEVNAQELSTDCRE